MKILNIVWLQKIVDKLKQKHRVSIDEVEEIFPSSRTRFRFVEKGDIPGEDVYSALGQTKAGRFLIVFFVYKKTKEALVISARDMDSKESRLYEKK
ncbi:MAG: BrnT family toxin [Thermodesulfobacteriota bacterium]